MIRTTTAILIAPLWALVFSALFMGMILPELAPLFPADQPLHRALMWASMGFVMAYIPMVVLALPAHLVLRKMQRQSLPAYIVTWFLLGFAQWAITHLIGLQIKHRDLPVSLMLEDLVHNISLPLWFSPAWMLSGATFWLIVRPGRTASAQQPA